MAVFALIALAVPVVVAFLLAITIPTFLGARERAELRSAQREIAPTCQPFLAMSSRLQDGAVPTQEEMAATVDPMVELLGRAAVRHDDFRRSDAAAVELEQIPITPAPANGRRQSPLGLKPSAEYTVGVGPRRGSGAPQSLPLLDSRDCSTRQEYRWSLGDTRLAKALPQLSRSRRSAERSRGLNLCRKHPVHHRFRS